MTMKTSVDAAVLAQGRPFLLVVAQGRPAVAPEAALAVVRLVPAAGATELTGEGGLSLEEGPGDHLPRPLVDALVRLPRRRFVHDRTSATTMTKT